MAEHSCVDNIIAETRCQPVKNNPLNTDCTSVANTANRQKGAFIKCYFLCFITVLGSVNSHKTFSKDNFLSYFSYLSLTWFINTI